MQREYFDRKYLKYKRRKSSFFIYFPRQHLGAWDIIFPPNWEVFPKNLQLDRFGWVNPGSDSTVGLIGSNRVPSNKVKSLSLLPSPSLSPTLSSSPKYHLTHYHHHHYSPVISHSFVSPFSEKAPLSFWSETVNNNTLEPSFRMKHCQRHNGPEGWVQLTKVTCLGHIKNSNNHQSYQKPHQHPRPWPGIWSAQLCRARGSMTRLISWMPTLSQGDLPSEDFWRWWNLLRTPPPPKVSKGGMGKTGILLDVFLLLPLRVNIITLYQYKRILVTNNDIYIIFSPGWSLHW